MKHLKKINILIFIKTLQNRVCPKIGTIFIFVLQMRTLRLKENSLSHRFFNNLYNPFLFMPFTYDEKKPKNP